MSFESDNQPSPATAHGEQENEASITDLPQTDSDVDVVESMTSSTIPASQDASVAFENHMRVRNLIDELWTDLDPADYRSNISAVVETSLSASRSFGHRLDSPHFR
jgi:hypothetical protein